MRKSGEVSLLIVALGAGSACNSGAAPVPVATSVEQAPAPNPPAADVKPPIVQLDFRVSAAYPATVLYALDRASSPADERYVRWLFGDAQPPDWFVGYEARRGTWRGSAGSGDTQADAYAACGYGAETLEALLECATPLLSAADLELARTALQNAAGVLQPAWLELQPVLQRGQHELQQLTSGEVGERMGQFLLQAAQLPLDQPLSFEVVLVARPSGGRVSRARQSDRHLVLELGADQAAASRVHIVFHELAHLAAQRAPRREELEQAFVGRGLPGLLAANLWNETFATAFGNGLVARAFDPRAPGERPLYENSAIDALARAVWSSWEAGVRPTLDARFSEQMLQALASAWPRERWRPADLLARVMVLSDDEAAGAALRQGIRPSWLHQEVPLPAELPPPAGSSRRTPLLIAATLDTLQRRPDVMLRFELDPREVTLEVTRHGASLYWLAGDDDVRLLIAAPDRDALRDAARSFAGLQPLPEPGWTALHAAGSSAAQTELPRGARRQ